MAIFMLKNADHKPFKEWIPDSYTNSCENCSQEFSLFNRRHHCRCCGQIFCHDCSNKSVQINKYESKLMRVCNQCFCIVQLCLK